MDSIREGSKEEKKKKNKNGIPMIIGFQSVEGYTRIFDPNEVK